MPTEEGRTRVRLEFDLRTLLAVLVAIAAALVLSGLVSSASQPLGWALACAVVAALVIPVAGLLDRWLPHALAVVAVMAGLALMLGGAWAGVTSTVVDNVNRIADEAPAAAAEIESRSQIARDFDLERRVDDFVTAIQSDLGTEAQLQESASTASTYVVTGILVLFLVGYGRRFVAGALAQIDDTERRERATQIVADAFVRWYRYVWVALGQATMLTLVGWGVFWALDLPGPFVLALVFGVFSTVPYVGAVFGGLGALLFAVATTDVTTIVATVSFVLAVQLLEAFVVRRRVDPPTVYVGPAVPLIVGLLGWELYGLGGMLYSVLLAILGLAVLDAARRLPAVEPTVADDATATSVP